MPPMDTDRQLLMENLWLPTDDDITSSDSEAEQNDLASDENIVPESDSDDDWAFIVGVSHDFR